LAQRKKKTVEPDGVAHIRASFNNTIVTLTDTKGNTISWSSAGRVGFQGSKKSTGFVAQLVASNAAEQAIPMGLRRVEALVWGPGPGRQDLPAARREALPQGHTLQHRQVRL
jgi:small subunit ribosomal protein S11